MVLSSFPLSSSSTLPGCGRGIAVASTTRAERVKSRFSIWRITRAFTLAPSPVKILAIETSTELCSAALWRDGAVDAREVVAGQRNSELLLPMIETLLAETAVAVRDL